jgi:thiol-disulfide isomerase/thioredoxin|tara:strand:+ start:318 stop:614 length:297 start_codon:yes stop_codon:yes gene_type:complete
MVIELKKDNLADHMDEERLLVVASTNWCGSCTKLRPHLYNISDDFTIVILDAEKHIRSMNFLPGKTSFYPRVGYYEKGYYIGEIQQLDIINGLKLGEI